MITGRVLLFLCVVIWGWTFVFTKVALNYLSPEELLGLRLLTGLPIQLAVILAKRISFRFVAGHYRRILLGGAIITVHFLIQITGIKYTSATNTGWLIAVSPLILALLSYVFLREKIGGRLSLGIVLATLGVLLLISKGHFTEFGWLESIGDWLVLGSAFTWAVYTVVTRDISRRGNPLAVTFAILLPATVLMTAYMIPTSDWSYFLHLPSRAVWSVLFLGVLGMGVAHWFWQDGVARLGAARAGVFLYIEPLATTALAVPYLHEQFGLFSALGGMLVLAGVYVAQGLRRRKLPA